MAKCIQARQFWRPFQAACCSIGCNRGSLFSPRAGGLVKIQDLKKKIEKLVVQSWISHTWREDWGHPSFVLPSTFWKTKCPRLGSGPIFHWSIGRRVLLAVYVYRCIHRSAIWCNMIPPSVIDYFLYIQTGILKVALLEGGDLKKQPAAWLFVCVCVVWRWSTTNCASSNGLKTWVPVQEVRRRCLTAMKAVASMVNSCFHLLLSFSYTRNISQFMLCYMSEQPDQSKVASSWMLFVWFASSTCFRRWKQRWCVFAQNTWSLGLGIIQNTSCKESWLSIFCITFILRLQPFLVLHVYGWWPRWIHGKNMFSVDIEDLSQLCSNGSRHWLQAQGDLPGAMNQ